MKSIYTMELLSMMNLFEKITHSRLKDCFENKDKLIFLVQQGQLRIALGKQNKNVKKLEDSLKKKIKIVEFNKDLLTFIRNLMYPLKIVDMQEDENIVTIKGPDAKTKGLMIGSRAQNLRNYEEITKKYFNKLEEIKVI